MYPYHLINKHTDDALKKYGIGEQSRMAMEEAGEFIHAVNKLHRNPCQSTKEHLAEEIAGLLKTIDQLETFYGLRGEIIKQLELQNNKLAGYLRELP